MPEIACKTPRTWAKSGLNQLSRDLTAKKYPHLKDPKQAKALARLTAREAGLDIDTYEAIMSGKISKATTGGKALKPKPVSAVPSPKTSVGKVERPKPVAVLNEKPFVAEVVDIATDSVQFDWKGVAGSIKNADHRKVVDGVLDRMSRLIGKDPLTRLQVEIKSKLPDNALGAHVGNKVILNSDLMTKKFVAEAAKMQRTGFWVKTKNLTGAEATMVHEIGHDLMEAVMTSSLAPTALRGLADEIGSSLSLGHEHVVANWIKKNADAIGSKVSRYALEDPHELYAEMWTLYVDDPLGCAPWIKMFGDTIVSTMRR